MSIYSEMIHIEAPKWLLVGISLMILKICLSYGCFDVMPNCMTKVSRYYDDVGVPWREVGQTLK